MRHSVRIGAIAALTLSVLASGCGQKASENEDDPLETYKKAMTAFYKQVSDADDRINAIDPDSEGAVPELLEQLDGLNKACSDMAELNIPADFSGVGDLPEEAADYMDRAVNAYHRAYDGADYGEFDESYLDTADQYYDKANLRIRRILAVLHGDPDAKVE